MFSVRYIEAFLAVMITRSMTAAADLLFVTQSAVSKLIKEFEEQVDFEFFTRKRGGCRACTDVIHRTGYA